jgi:inorganic phosphate transporter, PiT family
MLTAIIVITIAFALINGFHDGCNTVATIVASRSMAPRKALAIACLAEFCGGVFLGTTVAMTIGKGILAPEFFNLPPNTLYKLLLSALSGGIIWNLLTWYLGLPSSSSHALIGGLVGAGIMMLGFDAILWANLLRKVIIPLFAAPLLGFVAGYLLIAILIDIFRNHHPSVGDFFKRVQFFSMIFLACGHGSNDSQKSMGIIALALAAGTTGAAFSIPPWVIVSCAAALAVGVSFGGWKIIKTVNRQISQITSLHSLSSQMASGATIYFCSIFGFPISSTQIIGSSVMGVGAGYRIKSVRWAVAKDVLSAWFITIPAASSISALLCLLIKHIG